MEINEIVVMYLDADEIERPASPPDVSPVKGILSSYSFLFLGTPGHYAMRAYSCWCPACARVRGRGHGCTSRGAHLEVPGCTRCKLTVWKEDKFTVRPASGIKEREKRIAETLAKQLPKAKPGVWGCVQVGFRIERQPSCDCLHALLTCCDVTVVQARELWSTKEEVHLRPGHHWLFEFGDAGDGTCFETLENGKKEFTLAPRKWVDHKGTRFYNGDRVMVIKRWLHRVDEDSSGLTFKEWDPKEDADPKQPPLAMIANSSELRAAGFKLKERLPLELEQAARGGMRMRGAGLRQLEGMGPIKWWLEQDVDNDFRTRCE